MTEPSVIACRCLKPFGTARTRVAVTYRRSSSIVVTRVIMRPAARALSSHDLSSRDISAMRAKRDSPTTARVFGFPNVWNSGTPPQTTPKAQATPKESLE
ncbi:hypothetical protein BPORC_1904 [Bifidobacterium porcinum]|nr:hypothetical protein BPORC_1904 [Bifidobacterium porcinum]